MMEHEPFPAGKSGGTHDGGGPAWFDKVLLLAVLLYCTLPGDFIPHEAGVLGNVDDLALIAGLLTYLWKKPISPTADSRAASPENSIPSEEKPQ